ncbi:MAG: transposase family protein, partial [Gammaproteobacteria bacterium]|nr:transposase family protein [Gammaproteobacteria bacterium]
MNHVFQRVAVDIAGPFKPSKGKRYLLIVVDFYTKYAECYPMANQEAKTIAKTFFSNFICRYGVPNELISDCGANFLSDLFRGLLKLIDCSALKTTPLMPSANGQAERSIRSVKNILRSYVYRANYKWLDYLSCALFSYNVHQHSGTKATPFRLLHGYDA